MPARHSFFFLCAFLMTSARAEVWTWERCREQTAKTNPELEAARRTLGAAEYQVRGAYAGFFPQASVSLGYSHGSNTSTSGFIPEGGADETRSRYTASLTVSQNLFNGFQDKARIDQAAADRRAAEADLEIVRARLSADLKSAFAGLAYAQKAIRLTREIVSRREANLKLIELRFESGRENRGSLVLSGAYLEQARLDALQAENALRTARVQLRRVLGLDGDGPLEVAGSPPSSAPPAALDFFAIARVTPEYRKAEAQERSADAAITLAGSAFFPTLNLTGSTTRSDETFFPGNQRWSIGASLTLPFFSGGRDYYATKGASERHKAAALSRENALRAGLARLQQTHAAFQEADRKLEVDRRFSEAAGTRAVIAREKYNNGLLSFEDWDIIENDLINRQTAFLRSERDRFTAEAAWEQAQGKGVLP